MTRVRGSGPKAIDCVSGNGSGRHVTESRAIARVEFASLSSTGALVCRLLSICQKVLLVALMGAAAQATILAATNARASAVTMRAKRQSRRKVKERFRAKTFGRDINQTR